MLLSLNLCAQIENEIKSFVDSTEIIVNNGRKLLLEKISNNEYSKAREIYQYLTNKTQNNSYSAFYYTEDVYINMLVGDWYNLSQIMLDYKNKSKKTLAANTFQIVPLLSENVSLKSDSLLSDCKKSELDIESIKVIEIILHLLKTGSVDSEYNLKLNAFNKEYKPSRYDDLLKYYIPKSRIKGAISWAIGSGMIFTTEKLAINFRPNASINMSMDVNIQRVFTSLYLNGANLKLQRPFDGNTGSEILSFRKDESFHFLDAGLKGGYFLIRSDKFQVAPFLSASGGFLESTRYDSEDDDNEYKIFSSFTYGFGLHTEFKLTDFNTPNYYGYYTHSYISMKFETGYSFITKFNNNNFKGNMPYFNIALVLGMGDF